MTTPGADPACGAVRHSSGNSGDQEHTEAKVDPMGPEAAAPDLFTGWITVDQPTMECVEKITTLRGAHEDETWNHRQDLADAIALRRLLPGIAAAIQAAEGVEDESATLDGKHQTMLADALERAESHLARAAREIVSGVWERPRHRLSGKARITKNLAHGMAYSPAARKLILPKGAVNPAKPAGRLELEHVVPASTVAKLVAAMLTGGKSAADTAIALRSCIHQVVVVKNPLQIRDQPNLKVMNESVEALLIRYHLGKIELGPDELFRVHWSRYLSPEGRGTDGNQMTWHLGDLRTLS